MYDEEKRLQELMDEFGVVLTPEQLKKLVFAVEEMTQQAFEHGCDETAFDFFEAMN